jgi:hypothetical protein
MSRVTEIKEISRELGVSEEELVRKGVKTYLEVGEWSKQIFFNLEVVERAR